MSGKEAISYEVALRLFVLPAGISCVLSPDGHVEYANAEAERVLQYSGDDFGRLSILDLLHPEDRKNFEEALRDPEGRQDVQCRVRASDDEYKWLRWIFVAAGERIFA